MAEKAFPGGMMLLYGVAVANALAKGQATTEELLALREQLGAIVSAQGDLAMALDQLDKEVERRGVPRPKSTGPVSAATIERFTVQLEGIDLSQAAKQRIETRLGEAVMAELAAVDTGGDLVQTPLSALKGFGGSIGGATFGFFIKPKL